MSYQLAGTPAPPPGPVTVAPPGRAQVGQGDPGLPDAIRSEWYKFKTLRSTWWTLVVACALVIGLSALISLGAGSHPDGNTRLDALRVIQASWDLGILALMVLGVMVVTNEYSSGLIGASFMATPRRARVLLAKVVVFTVAILVLSEMLSFAEFLVGHAVLGAYPAFPNIWLTDHDVLRSVIGIGIYATLCALIGLGSGALLRHTAAGIAACVGFIFVLPGALSALPSSWSNPIGEYWPTQAGRRVAELVQGPHTLTAWWGIADLAGFVLVLLVVAGFLMAERDA